jgi:hypothetical protein
LTAWNGTQYYLSNLGAAIYFSVVEEIVEQIVVLIVDCGPHINRAKKF